MISHQTFELEIGAHQRREDGVCLMEAAAMLAGEDHTAYPACVHPVLKSIGVSCNDAIKSHSDRQDLKAFLPRFIGTANAPEREVKRWLRRLGDGLDRIDSTIDPNDPLFELRDRVGHFSRLISPGDFSGGVISYMGAITEIFTRLDHAEAMEILDSILPPSQIELDELCRRAEERIDQRGRGWCPCGAPLDAKGRCVRQPPCWATKPEDEYPPEPAEEHSIHYSNCGLAAGGTVCGCLGQAIAERDEARKAVDKLAKEFVDLQRQRDKLAEENRQLEADEQYADQAGLVARRPSLIAL